MHVPQPPLTRPVRNKRKIDIRVLWRELNVCFVAFVACMNGREAATSRGQFCYNPPKKKRQITRTKRQTECNNKGKEREDSIARQSTFVLKSKIQSHALHCSSLSLQNRRSFFYLFSFVFACRFSLWRQTFSSVWGSFQSLLFYLLRKEGKKKLLTSARSYLI